MDCSFDICFTVFLVWEYASDGVNPPLGLSPEGEVPLAWLHQLPLPPATVDIYAGD